MRRTTGGGRPSGPAATRRTPVDTSPPDPGGAESAVAHPAVPTDLQEHR
ncbi:hypothetical protein O7606_06210 [Micromonospora sp. WMMD882]|nr:hypothetical protein [Micromonospora sp. WMMD882]WBB80973.1 hypothetical protein O7606_06210 [Micromonospora sp. WMMD882]